VKARSQSTVSVKDEIEEKGNKRILSDGSVWKAFWTAPPGSNVNRETRTVKDESKSFDSGIATA
jgi:hypothetical protein